MSRCIKQKEAKEPKGSNPDLLEDMSTPYMTFLKIKMDNLKHAFIHFVSYYIDRFQLRPETEKKYDQNYFFYKVAFSKCLQSI